MPININELLPQMAAAASGVLKSKWPDAKEYAESEFRKIGESLLFIESQLLAGKMNQKQAQLHVSLQKNASLTVMLALEGLSILAVEAAINAALGIIRDAINNTLGFVLL